MAPKRQSPLPPLEALHERHPGFNRPICEAYAQAAAVCLSDSHTSPTDLEVRRETEECLRSLAWSSPDERARASWANRDDATRDGAYAVSLAAVEVELGLFALARSDVRTGADYYVGPLGADLEACHRLEVSGLRHGSAEDVRTRLREKVKQAKKAGVKTPAFACAVGFGSRVIMLARASDADE